MDKGGDKRWLDFNNVYIEALEKGDTYFPSGDSHIRFSIIFKDVKISRSAAKFFLAFSSKRSLGERYIEQKTKSFPGKVTRYLNGIYISSISSMLFYDDEPNKVTVKVPNFESICDNIKRARWHFDFSIYATIFFSALYWLPQGETMVSFHFYEFKTSYSVDIAFIVSGLTLFSNIFCYNYLLEALHGIEGVREKEHLSYIYSYPWALIQYPGIIFPEFIYALFKTLRHYMHLCITAPHKYLFNFSYSQIFKTFLADTGGELSGTVYFKLFSKAILVFHPISILLFTLSSSFDEGGYKYLCAIIFPLVHIYLLIRIAALYSRPILS